MKTIIFISATLLSFNIFAQKDVIFTAELIKDSIGIEEYVQIVFTIENARQNGFTPPEFADFERVLGPNTSSEISIVNGEMTQKSTLTYTLIPNDKGTYVIEPASLTVGKETYKTEHTKVTVLEVAKTPNKEKRTQPYEEKEKSKTIKKKKRKIYKI